MAAAAAPVQIQKPGLTLLAVCVGAFMATLDTSIVNIALPQIARNLGASLNAISWVMIAYLIANASLLLSSSRLGDMLAPGRLFLIGMVIFSLASTACGFSTQTWQLILGRAIQGAGASLMLGVAPKIITLVYPEGARGLPFGLFSTAFATGISVGAPLGAFITSAWGWPWVFFIKLPICVLAVLAAGRLLMQLRPLAFSEQHHFDWLGGVFFTVSISLFMWALTQVRSQGWLNPKIVGAMAGAGLTFLLLLLVERRQKMPLLSGVLWQTPAFFLGALAVVLTFAAVMGTFFLLPFYLEEIIHLPPATVGWMLAILSFSNAMVSPMGGLAGDRWNNLLVVRLGALLILGGLSALFWLGPAISNGLLVLDFMVIGIGFGLFQAPNLNEMLQGIKPHMLGLAAGTNAVLKNIGALLGIALMVTMVSMGDGGQLNVRGGLGWVNFQRAFALSAALGMLNLLFNLLPRGGMVVMKNPES
jgi:EmrB/QacA subfamily drug resistance transporter